MNIEQMTQKTREALQAAQRIAVEYSNNAVEQEHLLAALAQQQDGLIPQLLQTLGIDANAFAQAALQKVEVLPRVTGSGRFERTIPKFLLAKLINCLCIDKCRNLYLGFILLKPLLHKHKIPILLWLSL